MNRPRRPRRSNLTASLTAKIAAPRLRREATMPERVLWNRLKGLRADGLVFRRQHPLGPFVADFYCHAAALVVEVDGAWVHDAQRGPADRSRQAWMESRGLKVVRVPAGELPRNAAEITGWIARVARERVKAFEQDVESAR